MNSSPTAAQGFFHQKSPKNYLYHLMKERVVIEGNLRRGRMPNGDLILNSEDRQFAEDAAERAAKDYWEPQHQKSGLWSDGRSF